MPNWTGGQVPRPARPEFYCIDGCGRQPEVAGRSRCRQCFYAVVDRMIKPRTAANMRFRRAYESPTH